MKKKLISLLKNLLVLVSSTILFFTILEFGSYLIVKAFPQGYYDKDYKNSHGLRDPRESAENDNTIIVLGDSFTYGTGVRSDDSYPAQLEKKLKESFPDRDIAVINGGKPGFDTKLTYQRLKQIYGYYKPKYVVIGFTAGDIVGDQIDYRKMKNSDVVKEDIVNTDHEVQRKIHKRETAYSRIIKIRSYLQFNSNFAQVLTFYYKNYFIKFIDMPQFMKNMRSDFGLSEEFEATEYFLDQIYSFLLNKNTKMILLFNVPLYNFDAFPYENVNTSLRNYAEERDIYYINTHDAFSEFKSADLWVSIKDGHYNAKANSLVAASLHDLFATEIFQ